MNTPPEQRLADVRAHFENPALAVLPVVRHEAAIMLAAADAYQGGVTQLAADLAAVENDPALDAGRRRRHREAVLAGWAHRQDGALQPLDARAVGIIARAEAQLRAPKLDPDESTASVRLQAAERQVKRMLEPLPVSQLPAELRDLAASAEHPDIRYLLVTKTWAAAYLRRRGADAEAEPFEAGRRELLRPLLPEWAVRTLDALPDLEKAAGVPALLRELYDAERQRRGMPPAPVLPEPVAYVSPREWPNSL